jgi:hypothetical protein
MKTTHETVLKQIRTLYETLYQHDGFGEMRIEMRLLKRGQKEIILHCGKQYRYVLDYEASKISSPMLPASRGCGENHKPANSSLAQAPAEGATPRQVRKEGPKIQDRTS